MKIIRNVEKRDLEDLYKLSQLANFINLPQDKKIIEEKINLSLKSFVNPDNNLTHNFYIFVCEDLNTQKVCGVSMIHAQHGTEDEPHFFLKIKDKKKHSSTIDKDFTYRTLKLGWDTDGPTEIGALIVFPEYRGHKDKIGKQLSYARFLYMANNPFRFKDTIHCELMPPFNEDGSAPLWEAIGRKFMKMNYLEADKLSRTNKEFILSLFPKENIYFDLLPESAQQSIGLVGEKTAPVKHMLEKIGFHYTNEVDPFDGGPHYRAKLRDITLVKKRFQKQLSKKESSLTKKGILQFNVKDYQFFAMQTSFEFDNHRVLMSDQDIKSLELKNDIITGIEF